MSSGFHYFLLKIQLSSNCHSLKGNMHSFFSGFFKKDFSLIFYFSKFIARCLRTVLSVFLLHEVCSTFWAWVIRFYVSFRIFKNYIQILPLSHFHLSRTSITFMLVIFMVSHTFLLPFPDFVHFYALCFSLQIFQLLNPVFFCCQTKIYWFSFHYCIYFSILETSFDYFSSLVRLSSFLLFS